MPHDPNRVFFDELPTELPIDGTTLDFWEGDVQYFIQYQSGRSWIVYRGPSPIFSITDDGAR